MSKIKNGGLDQYGTEPFEPQQLALKGLNQLGDLGKRFRAARIKMIATTCDNHFEYSEVLYSVE